MVATNAPRKWAPPLSEKNFPVDQRMEGSSTITISLRTMVVFFEIIQKGRRDHVRKDA